MDLEKVLIVRPDGGRLAVTELVVTPSYADGLAAELKASAAPAEEVLLVRACGMQLELTEVQLPSEVADRIVGDALAERVL